MRFHREAFIILGYPIYWYGIVIALGVLCAILVSLLREKRVGVPKDTTINVALCAIPLGLVFARLYYVLFSLDQYLADPKSIFNIREGGLAIWGGVIGGALATLLYARVKKIPFLRLADLLCPGLVLAQGIGRWGNFFNQEAYGVQILRPALQVFPIAVYIEARGGWFAATFFYESVWCVLVCALLLALERRGKRRGTGDLFLWYLILYGFERSIVEGLRLDSLMLGSVRVSQLLSLALMFVGALPFYARLCSANGKRAAKRAFGALLLLGLAAPVLLCLGVLNEYMIVPAALLPLIAAIGVYHRASRLE
jgi:phosphatidylglycerol:prolipoprotein diacylglycerol transferase